MAEHIRAETVSFLPNSPNNIVIPIKNTGSGDGWIESSTIHITFNDLRYSVQPKAKGAPVKEILRGINGYFRGGSSNIILGPSGAGKTSLMSILCGVRGKKDGVNGDVRVNGIVSSQEVLRNLVCYIPQEFELMPTLTTKETIYFAARLKMPRTDKVRISSLVRDVATKLGLAGSLDTRAGNLSGGQKKRLSIGTEIVVNPRVLVLDEPTSGLDSTSSVQLISLLKNLTETGCTVVYSIHQPSSHMITLFDEILVLAAGRDLYCGPRDNIVETFEEGGFRCPPFYNIAEYVIEVVTGQHGGDLDLLRRCGKKFTLPVANQSNGLNDDEQGNEIPISIRARDRGTGFRNYCYNWQNELQVLTIRSVKCVLRDMMMTRLRLAAHILVGFFLGATFYDFGDEASKVQSNISCLFFFIMYLFLAQSLPAVQTFPIEAAVFKREYSNSWYGLVPYYLAKVVTDLPLQLLCPTGFLLPAYFLTNQPPEFDRFMRTWTVCVLISMLAQSFGIFVGALTNAALGSFIVPAFNIPLCLIAGFFLKLGEMPSYIYPFSYISYFRYAFEAMMVAIYGNGRKTLQCSEAFCLFKRPEKILKEMDMPSTDFFTPAVAVFAWVMLIHMLVYIVLRCQFVRASP